MPQVAMRRNLIIFDYVTKQRCDEGSGMVRRFPAKFEGQKATFVASLISTLCALHSR